MTLLTKFMSAIRDGILLYLLILLVFFPTKLNEILVDAGLEEGSVAGFKWKKKVTSYDIALKDLRASYNDLLEEHNNLVAAVNSNDTAAINDYISESETLNQSAVLASAKASETIESNADIVKKAEVATNETVLWGVVFGGDRSLEAAIPEVTTNAKAHNIPNARVYLRNNSYRSVSSTAIRAEAEAILQNAQQLRSDSYIVNMKNWCPEYLLQDGYFECVPR